MPTGLGEDTFVAGYRILDVLGAGGMGVVYRAHQPSLDREVALKVISPPYLGEDRFRSCFERESRLAASIEHPHVLPVYEAGEDDGLLFIAMQLVAGCDLGRLIASDWPLHPQIAVRIVSQVAEALDAAHARGLVHRDVKPTNVLIAERGDDLHAYLADFGLCCREGSHTGLTGTGGFVGTADYMAPEQIATSPVDGRADVYALGCVLFKLLTGEPPFLRDAEFGTLWAHMREDPPPVSCAAGVPPALDVVVRCALAKDPDDRYQSAGEFALEAVAAAGPDAGAGPMPTRKTGRCPRAATMANSSGSRPPASLRRSLKTVRWSQSLLVAGLAALTSLALVAASSRGGHENSPPRFPGAAMAVGGHPTSLVAAGGELWFASRADGLVWIIDRGTNSARGRPVRVGREPVAITSQSGAVWVANYASRTVTRIDQRTHRIVGRPTRVPGRPYLLAPRGHYVWVESEAPGTLSVIEARSGRLVGRPTTLPTRPRQRVRG